jgi:hypothetical protein
LRPAAIRTLKLEAQVFYLLLNDKSTAADARRCGGILQSDSGTEAEQAGESRSGRLGVAKKKLLTTDDRQLTAGEK